MKKQKNYGYDMKEILSSSRTFLMGIAMISVVMFHERLLPANYLTTMFRLYGNWGVHIFLFVSGFGCAYAMGKYRESVFYKRRILRLLPVCFIVGLAMESIDTHLRLWEYKWELLKRMTGVTYWYIQAIMMLYLLTPLFYHAIKRWKATGFFCLLLLVCIAQLIVKGNIGSFCIHYALLSTPLYLMGLYVGIHNFRISKWQFMISILSCAFAMYIRLFHYEYSWAFRYSMFISLAVPAICCALDRGRQYCAKIRLNEIIETIGIYSLEIYLIHEYVIHSLYTVTFAGGLPAPYEWLIKVIAFIVILTIACKATRLIADFIVSKFK